MSKIPLFGPTFKGDYVHEYEYYSLVSISGQFLALWASSPIWTNIFMAIVLTKV